MVEPLGGIDQAPAPDPPTAPLDRPRLGIACALLGMAGIAVMDGLAKYLVERYPVGQVVFIRNLLALLPLCLLLWREGGLKALKTRQPGLQILRGLLLFGAAVAFFLGLRFLGLAEATVLAFAAPLFITALSVPLLGERGGAHRWSAVILGFLGVLAETRCCPPAGPAEGSTRGPTAGRDSPRRRG